MKNPASRILLRPGTLWPAIVRRTQEAIAWGALQSIQTHQTFLEEGGMRFAVRIAANLERKARERRRQARAGGDANPFLPPEPELTVAPISDTHLAVLNKFNVVDHHLLIVTRRFEEQEALLSLADFEALWAAMAEYPALGFYNGGRVAGASQRHKHLQTIPLPLYEGGPQLPIDPLIEAVPSAEGLTRLPVLPFRHRLARLAPERLGDPVRAAWQTRRLYLEMLRTLDIPPVQVEGEQRQSYPYNLLLTRRWMMVVPRRAEHVGSTSVNAMGFAGSLFVRNEEALEAVRRVGPMTLLREVA